MLKCQANNVVASITKVYGSELVCFCFCKSIINADKRPPSSDLPYHISEKESGMVVDYSIVRVSLSGDLLFYANSSNILVLVNKVV